MRCQNGAQELRAQRHFESTPLSVYKGSCIASLWDIVIHLSFCSRGWAIRVVRRRLRQGSGDYARFNQLASTGGQQMCTADMPPRQYLDSSRVHERAGKCWYL